MKRSKVIKTEYGWEPAFFYRDLGWVIEPGCAAATREEAQARLDEANRAMAQSDAAEARYRSEYDYACGYYD